MSPDQGGLLFVDPVFGSGGWDLVAGAVRSIPPSLIGESSRILLRSPLVRWMGPVDDVADDAKERAVLSPGPDWPSSPDEFVERLGALLDAHHLPRRALGVFELPAGGSPALSEGVIPEDLAECRRTEIESYLRCNGAIWEPASYHYQLPSGHHAGSFVRVADALKDPHATAALSSWMYGSLTEGTAVVVDSGTLMPLVGQLDFVIRRAASKLRIHDGLVAIEALDRYPLSRFEFLRRFKPLAATDILALLSVSSTGRTYRMLKRSLAETAEGMWRSECLVARGQDHAQTFPDPLAPGDRDPWLQIEDLLPPTDPGTSCGLCRDPHRARVIHINPSNFAAMALPIPRVLMPNTSAAWRNGSLFEAYQASNAHTSQPAVQLAGTERSRMRAKPFFRPMEPRRVRFEPLHLLVDDVSLGSRMEERVSELRTLRRSDPRKERIVAALDRLQRGKPTIAVCDHEELTVLTNLLREQNEADPASAAKSRFLTLAQGVCPTVNSVVSDKDDGFDGAFDEHQSVLLVAAGLQTGVTLQHLVVTVQDAFRDVRDPQMHGLVLHAHPNDSEAWASVRNSFGGRKDPSLLALWLTYLPNESPFSEEWDLLRIAQDDWFRDKAAAEALWRERLSWLRTNGGDHDEAPVIPPSPLLSPSTITLRRTSIYGAVDDRHVIPAIGAALAESLDRHLFDGSPEWVRIDLPNAFRSYFDGLLHVALLRWVSPERAWWGSANECVSLIDELRGRFIDSGDWHLLLCELLLAAAQGKVPSEGVEQLLAHAHTDASGFAGPRERAFLDLAVILVTNIWEPEAPRNAALGTGA